jgi:hypothetical protein
MKILAHRIKRELNLGESTQCAVYEDELKRLWPLNHKEREAKIAPSLRRNTDPSPVLPQGTARNLRQVAATKATFVILSSQIMTLPATAPLLSWTIGIVLQGSKRFTQLCPPERIESWLWATGYQGCGVAIRRRRVVVCGGGMLLESGPGLPPYVGRQAKQRLHYKTGKKNFPFKSLLVALSGEPEPFSPIVLDVARAFQVALIQVELLL